MRINCINNHITKYTFGTPFNTESVVLKEGSEIENQGLKYLNFENNTFTLKLKDDDIVYGLGENDIWRKNFWDIYRLSWKSKV